MKIVSNAKILFSINSEIEVVKERHSRVGLNWFIVLKDLAGRKMTMKFFSRSFKNRMSLGIMEDLLRTP